MYVEAMGIGDGQEQLRREQAGRIPAYEKRLAAL
jgi:hypothetical protein